MRARELVLEVEEKREPSLALSECARGARAMLPILLGVVPFAMATGVATVNAGLSAATSLAMSAIVFAGASHLAAIQLYSQDAPLFVIILTAAVINLRFVMYSASIAPYLRHLRVRTRAMLAYLLSDQAYAVSLHRFVGDDPPPLSGRAWFYFGGGITLWSSWMIGCAVGVFLGASVPPSWELEFSLPLVFLGLVLPALKDRGTIVAAVTAGTIAVVGRNAPMNLGLMIAATLGIAAGWIADRTAKPREEGDR